MQPAVLCGDLNMLRCFSDLTVPTVVVTSDPEDVTLRSRYCREHRVISPVTDGERVVADLIELGREYPERPVLFYGTDAMLLLISRNRDRLAPYFRFRIPDADLVERLVSKQSFKELANRCALPAPQTLSSEEVRDADDIEARLGLPCLFKPNVHIGWFKARAAKGLSPHKALTAHTRQELEHTLAELALHCDSYVVQRYVPGGEDCIFSYHAYLGERSRVLGEFTGRKIRTYPKHAGVSTYLELVHDAELLRLGHQICTRLGLVGPVKLDFKRDVESGELFLLEVNPRFTLWNYPAAVSGMNLPAIAHADLTERPLPAPTPYRPGLRWLSFGNDFRTFLRDYRPDQSIGTLAWLWSYRTPKVYEIWSLRDPAPFLANALKFTKVRLAKVARAALARGRAARGDA